MKKQKTVYIFQNMSLMVHSLIQAKAPIQQLPALLSILHKLEEDPTPYMSLTNELDTTGSLPERCYEWNTYDY
jgi:hypothetical protein